MNYPIHPIAEIFNKEFYGNYNNFYIHDCSLEYGGYFLDYLRNFHYPFKCKYNEHENCDLSDINVLENNTKFDAFLNGYDKQKMLYNDVKLIIKQYVYELIFVSKNSNVIDQLSDKALNNYGVCDYGDHYKVLIPNKLYTSSNGLWCMEVVLAICSVCNNPLNIFNKYGNPIENPKGILCKCL